MLNIDDRFKDDILYRQEDIEFLQMVFESVIHDYYLTIAPITEDSRKSREFYRVNRERKNSTPEAGKRLQIRFFIQDQFVTVITIYQGKYFKRETIPLKGFDLMELFRKLFESYELICQKMDDRIVDRLSRAEALCEQTHQFIEDCGLDATKADILSGCPNSDYFYTGVMAFKAKCGSTVIEVHLHEDEKMKNKIVIKDLTKEQAKKLLKSYVNLTKEEAYVKFIKEESDANLD